MRETLNPLAVQSATPIRGNTPSTRWASCGLDARTGSLRPGKDADIILLRTDDITAFPVTDPAGTVVSAGHPGLVDTVLVPHETREFNDADRVALGRVDTERGLAPAARTDPAAAPQPVAVRQELPRPRGGVRAFRGPCPTCPSPS